VIFCLGFGEHLGTDLKSVPKFNQARYSSLGYQFALPALYLGFSVANLQLCKDNMLILLKIYIDKPLFIWQNSFKLNLLGELRKNEFVITLSTDSEPIYRPESKCDTRKNWGKTPLL